MEPPAHSFKDFLTQPVAFSGPLRRVVGGAVAFYSRQVGPRPVWVPHREIDPKAGRPDLVIDLEAPLPDGLGNGFFERRIRVLARRYSLVKDARFRVAQKPLQNAGAIVGSWVQPDIAGVERDETLHWHFARVKSTFNLRSPPSAETGRKPCCQARAPRSGAVPYGNEDDVPLVALHVLQVLDEELLRRGLRGKGIEMREANLQRSRSDHRINSFCAAENVTTPNDKPGAVRACSTTASTTSRASISFVRLPPRS